MNDYTKLNNTELLEIYKLISDYVNELTEEIKKVNENDWWNKRKDRGI